MTTGRGRTRGSLAAALLVLLAGCASPPPAPLLGWSGKLGYQIEAGAERRAQAGSALFELHGDAGAGRIELSSPLGTLLARAHWASGGAWLDQGRGPAHYPNLDELGAALGEALQGPALPLPLLFDWLQGRPHPDWPHQALDDGFEQLGWQVRREAPERLLLSRPAQGGQGALRLRIVFSIAPA